MSVLLESSNSPVADEPIETDWFPLPAFLRVLIVDVPAIVFAVTLMYKLDKVPVERNKVCLFVSVTFLLTLPPRR